MDNIIGWPQQIKVYVLHVKSGYEQRAASMEGQLARLQIPFEYILDADIPDLTSEIITRHFIDDHRMRPAQLSCAMKHMLAYQALLASDGNGALILEDDMLLDDDFVSLFLRCIEELNEIGESKSMISLECSSLQFVPRSQRIKNRMLYRSFKGGRMGGCYYIQRSAAEAILDDVHTSGCPLPIDLYHTELNKHGRLNFFWAHPTMSVQGSFTGQFASSISQRQQSLIKFRWICKYNYKRILYFLR